ncbi:MAG: ATP-binding protein [Acidobacteriales bacterium]|nr:ATP-binding protein [Terriglobales bacterium]
MTVKPGFSFGLIGPPKSGKTHACLSTAKLPGEKYAFVAPVGECVAYENSGIQAEAYFDEDWKPSEGSFKSTGYVRMMAKLKELEKKSNLGVVIFDTANRGPSELIWHYVMQGYGTDDPRTLGGNSRQPYVTYASRLTELLERLDLLRYRAGCHLVMTFHEDMREAEGVGTPRREVEGGKTVTHWDHARLPMLRGGMRQDVAGWFDAAFYCEPVQGSNPFRCKFVVFPDAQRQAGTRLKIIKELQVQKEVPNDVAQLVALAGKALGR